MFHFDFKYINWKLTFGFYFAKIPIFIYFIQISHIISFTALHFMLFLLAILVGIY